MNPTSDAWYDYFKSIESVCPWSLESYMLGRIVFIKYNPKVMGWMDVHWDDWLVDAIVYYDAPDDPDYLDSLVLDLESDPSPNCIYFWSHPEYTKGGWNQAPEPIIIQQSQAQLSKIRANIKTYK